MEARTTINTMQQARTEAADFLLDVRRLPPELRWKIQGMVEAVDLFNATGPQPPKPTHAAVL